MVDVYTSRKQRKNSMLPFAFVRFPQLKDAQPAIKNLHGMEIRGCKISVTMAEYKRSGNRRVDNKGQTTMVKEGTNYGVHRKQTKGGRSYMDVVVQKAKQKEEDVGCSRRQNENDIDEGAKARYEKAGVVHGVVNKELMEELETSVVGETMGPVDVWSRN